MRNGLARFSMTNILSGLSLISVFVTSQANAQSFLDRVKMTIYRQSVNLCREQHSSESAIESCSSRTFDKAYKTVSYSYGEYFWEVGDLVCYINSYGTTRCERKQSNGRIKLDIIDIKPW